MIPSRRPLSRAGDASHRADEGRAGRRLRIAGAIALGVTAAGVVEALQLLVPGHHGIGPDGGPVGLPTALVRTVPSWWVLGLLVPLAGWLTIRWPLDSSRWRSSLLVHVPVSLIFPLVHMGLVTLLYVGGDGRAVIVATFLTLVQIYYVYDLFLYWLIVGAVQMIRSHRELKDREIQALRLRSDLTQTRLSALRAQLNPHFLFNSLNSVVGLALEKGDDDVADAVTELCELLREALRDDDRHLVPLRGELEFARKYLRVQTHRFGDRLAFATDVERGVEEALVPSMLLQPLVENAIVHGVLAGEGPGRVVVRAARENGRLRIDVEDTGPGFPARSVGEGPSTARVAADGGNGVASDRPFEAPRGEPAGVGLRNTRSRLRTLFGAEFDLVPGRSPEGGGAVTVRIPYLTAPPTRPAAEAAVDASA